MTTACSPSRLAVGLSLGFVLSSCQAPPEPVTLNPAIEAIVDSAP